MEPKKVVEVKNEQGEIKNKTDQTAKNAYLFAGASVATLISTVLYANSDGAMEQLASAALIGLSAGAASINFVNIIKDFKEDRLNNPDKKLKDYIFEEDSIIRTRKR